MGSCMAPVSVYTAQSSAKISAQGSFFVKTDFFASVQCSLKCSCGFMYSSSKCV